MSEEPVPNAPSPTDAQASAKAELEQIYNDPHHSFNQVGARDFDVAAAHVLGLRRIVQGEAARPVLEFREAADERPAARSDVAVPISEMFTAEDVAACLPGHMRVPEQRRFVTAALDVVGLSAFQAIQLSNLLTSTPLPPPEAELDQQAVVELWGAEAPGNIRLVNEVLTKIRHHSEEDYAELAPFVQRVPAVTNLIVAVGRRLGMGR